MQVQVHGKRNPEGSRYQASVLIHNRIALARPELSQRIADQQPRHRTTNEDDLFLQSSKRRGNDAQVW
jgi:hypothetical protein